MYNTESWFILIPPGSCLQILFYLPGCITSISDISSHMRSRLRCFENFTQGLISGIKYIFLRREKAGAGVAHLLYQPGYVKLIPCGKNDVAKFNVRMLARCIVTYNDITDKHIR